MSIETARLILRPWIEEDRKPFAEMSADPAVMKHLLPLGSHDGASAWIDRQMAHLAEHGFCFWALEEKESRAFVGSVGLLRVGYEAHFTPAVEVGWRLARTFWGRGYALEAAAASMRFGFEVLNLPEIVANTAIHNINSRRVMEKLGMSHDVHDDFDHPRIPEGHPLRHQALYRLARARWMATERSATKRSIALPELAGWRQEAPSAKPEDRLTLTTTEGPGRGFAVWSRTQV